jgi:hypothetical protein
MKEYQKIETLYRFDQATKRFTDEFYNKDVILLKDNKWIFTEKIDGTNFRIYWDGHKLTYAGRTDDSTFNKEQIDFIESELVNETREIVFEQKFQNKQVYVFGELYGSKIQNGGLYTDNGGMAFRVFDIEIDGIILTFENARELAAELGFAFVPYVFTGTIDEGILFVKVNEHSTFSKAKFEGLVGKPVGDFRDRLGNRIVVKIKRRDLLR